MGTGRAFRSLNSRVRSDGRLSAVSSDWLSKFRRERRILARVRRAAWRLEQAETERAWALVSARAEGISIRKLATAAGLSPTRVHQLTTGTEPDPLDTALGKLRAAGWPAPEDPTGSDDEELSGRAHVADRLGKCRVRPEAALPGGRYG